MEFSHIPVLFNETVDSLNITPDGVYADATAGGGGHSAAVLGKLSENGRLIMIDRDPDAIEALTSRFSGDKRAVIVNGNFADIKGIIERAGFSGADGIVADLGVSSHQLDSAERGFSFHKDAALDMRMSREGLSAADIVNGYDEQTLINIIYKYGEEKYAPSIAKHIVRERLRAPIETTGQLADIIKESIPARARREGGHPARRTFQAIRIEVNGELELLPGAVESMFDSLNENGVLSIITFHSLEDRIVKQKFKSFCEGCTCPKDFPICVCGKTPRGKLQFKAKEPSEEELQDNSRSRSAHLRSIIKLG